MATTSTGLERWLMSQQQLKKLEQMRLGLVHQIKKLPDDEFARTMPATISEVLRTEARKTVRQRTRDDVRRVLWQVQKQLELHRQTRQKAAEQERKSRQAAPDHLTMMSNLASRGKPVAFATIKPLSDIERMRRRVVEDQEFGQAGYELLDSNQIRVGLMTEPVPDDADEALLRRYLEVIGAFQDRFRQIRERKASAAKAASSKKPKTAAKR